MAAAAAHTVPTRTRPAAATVMFNDARADTKAARSALVKQMYAFIRGYVTDRRYSGLREDAPTMEEDERAHLSEDYLQKRTRAMNDDYTTEPPEGRYTRDRDPPASAEPGPETQPGAADGEGGGSSSTADIEASRRKRLLMGWLKDVFGHLDWDHLVASAAVRLLAHSAYGLVIVDHEERVWRHVLDGLDSGAGGAHAFNRVHSAYVYAGADAKQQRQLLNAWTGGPVVIKLQVLQDSYGREEAVKEDLILRFLNNVGSRKLKAVVADDCDTVAAGADAFPKFLYGCSVRTPYGVFRATFSEYLQGSISLEQFLRNPARQFTEEHYVQLERAVMMMWLCGFVHADLHLGNVLMVPRAMQGQGQGQGQQWRPCIIDMGHALRLTRAARTHIRNLWVRDYLTPRYRMFTREAITEVRRKMIRKGLKWTNVDWKLMLALKEQLGLDEGRILRARRAACARPVERRGSGDPGPEPQVGTRIRIQRR